MTISQINTRARLLGDTDSTALTDANLLVSVNLAIEDLISQIHEVCPTYDDENFANIASGTITLEEAVSKYTITDKFLNILEIKVKDVDGAWHFVTPYSLAEAQRDGVILETKEANTGLPLTYRKMGRTIWLAPAPTAASVTLTAGLKFVYTRTSYQITSDDDETLVPGIASPYHDLICYKAILPYCLSYKKDRVALYEKKIMERTAQMLSFYANLQKDKFNRMTVSQLAADNCE